MVVAPEVIPTKPEKLAEPDQVLLRAAEIVRERWKQHNYGTRGGPRCAIGALKEAAGVDLDIGVTGEMEKTVRSLGLPVPRTPGTALLTWNDKPGRTAEEVAEALERAAYGL